MKLHFPIPLIKAPFFILLLLLFSGCAATPLSRPNGVVPAPDGTLYVMDFGNYRVAHLNAEGQLLDTFGSFGDLPDQIFYGWDLAMDGEGNLYLAHIIQGTGRITQDGVKVFTNQGNLLREVGTLTYSETEQGTSNSPYGIDIDRKGYLYVADYGPNTLRIFGQQGELIGSFLGGEEAERLGVLSINDVAIDDGRLLLYITDFLGNQILQFKISYDENGLPQLSYNWTFGGYGREPGKFSFPQNLTVDDRNGYVYIGDIANRRIQVLTSSGNLLTTFRAPDVKDWQIMGMNVDEAGNLYVADALNNCIWIFAPNPQSKGEASLFLKRIEVNQ